MYNTCIMTKTTPILQDLREISRELVRELGFFKDECLGTGVSHPQSHALLSLALNENQSVSELASTLQIEQSSGSRLVEGLIKRKYLRKRPLSNDKRTKLLTLTTDGVKKVAEINEAADKRVADALELLSPEKQQIVLEGFNLYVHALQKSRLISEIDVIEITENDDASAANLVRAVMSEFGLARSGSAFTDPELNYMTKAYKQKGYGFHIAKHKGAVVGTAGFGPLKDGPQKTCLIQRMYLAPKFRNLGLGKRLLKKAEHGAKKNGYTHAYLETTAQMIGARKFYESRGYKPLDKPLGGTGYSLCTHWYVKEL